MSKFQILKQKKILNLRKRQNSPTIYLNNAVYRKTENYALMAIPQLLTHSALHIIIIALWTEWRQRHQWSIKHIL